MSHLRKTVLGRNMKTPGLGRPDNYNPVQWSEYFNSEQKIATDNGKFHIYRKGDSGLAIVCLHGGGYSGLTWSLFAVEITNAIDCQVIAIDLRGHGNSTSNDDTDLSLETLAEYIIAQ